MHENRQDLRRPSLHPRGKMKDIDNLALTAGIILLIGGLALITVAVTFVWPLIFYGVIATILGIVILLTLRQQEKIEPIKTIKKPKK